MDFMIYDISLLVIFVIFISVFLYRRKTNLKKEGLLLLYRTSWGMRLIDKVGKKFKRTLNFLSYLAIGLGYLLMGTIIYLFGKIVWVYVLNPQIVRAIKIPPIMPLIPYLPQAFKLDFLPSFYFIYWIIIIAIVAVVHEFAHGIFATNKGVRIKKTGFGFFPFFLPVFLAAFVELDEEQMKKKSIFSQMSVLAAGTFSNILTGIVFFLVMILFFSLAFAPVGVTFDSYTYSAFPIESVSMINDVSLESASYEEIIEHIDGTKIDVVNVGELIYDNGIAGFSQDTEGNYFIGLYDDAPAINVGLKGVITEINGFDINSIEKISDELLKYSPGEAITITTQLDGETQIYDIVLDENPTKEGVAFLGIGFSNQQGSGIIRALISKISSFKKPHIFYEAKFEAGEFIYNLLWWLVMVSFSIALVNMLPVGLFDGGRFFYLTILAITKKEKIAKRAFSIITYFFLALLAVIMVFWAISVFG
jgi:membrane-associated protease RseP (regulator of RpoE activity)